MALVALMRVGPLFYQPQLAPAIVHAFDVDAALENEPIDGVAESLELTAIVDDSQVSATVVDPNQSATPSAGVTVTMESVEIC